MTKKQCPLGEACDLTIAWMAGAEKAKDQIKAQAAEIERLRAALAKAVEDLGEIAQQKKTDELETEYDVEFADFEGGYDWCIDLARAALAELTGAKP